MRNLKRALSLALASVMLLGMMVVGTSAASYTDVDDNDNVEAIEVLNAVDVMIGRQGNFEPDEPVKRHEMATIMAKLVLGVETADNYVGTHPYTDVVPWADKYVAACYENGLTSGTSATTFGGNQDLTAVQAAAMMLRALGYKDLSKGADDWRAPVTAAANRIRLFDGVASNPSEKLNRNQVAQLALNTLKSPVVDTNEGLNITGSNGNYTFTINGDREYTARSSNKDFAKAIDNTEWQGTSASSIGGYTIELGEHLYNGKLQLLSTTDDFGRPCRRWEYNGKTVGTYVKEELMVKEYDGKVTGKDLYDQLGSTIINDYELTVTIDGVDQNSADATAAGVFGRTSMDKNNKAAVGRTGTGTLTQVFVENRNTPANKAGKLYIAIINTYLAKANQDYDSKKEELAITIYGADEISATGNYVKDSKKDPKTSGGAGSTITNVKLAVEDFPAVKDMKKDEFMLVNVAGGDVITIGAPEILSSVTISGFKINSDVVVGGEKYEFATTAHYKDSDLAKYTSANSNTINLQDTTYNVYLDQNGKLVGVEEVDPAKNYVFITGADQASSNYTNKTRKALGLFLDGTTEEITYKTDKGKAPGVGVNNVWCTYTKDSSGVYTLYQVAEAIDGNGDGVKDTGVELAQFNTKDSNPALYNGANGFTIDSKNSTLNTKKTVNSKNYDDGIIYGRDDTVYLVAELDHLTQATNPVTEFGAVKGAESVITDVKNADLKVWNQAGALTKYKNYSDLDAHSWGVYALYNDGYGIIAAVVIGEDNGASRKWYSTGDNALLHEDYNEGSTEARATVVNGEWTWTRTLFDENGDEVTLTERGDSASYLKNMNKNQSYLIKLDSKGEVYRAYRLPGDDEGSVKDIPTVTEAGLVGYVPGAADNSEAEYVTEANDIGAAVRAGKNQMLISCDVLNNKMTVSESGVLYVNNSNDSGILVNSDTKIVLIQINRNNRDTYTDGVGFSDVKSIIEGLNEDHNNGNYSYKVSAVADKRVAKSIVIWDYTSDWTGKPTTPTGKDSLTNGGVTLIVDKAVKASAFLANVTTNTINYKFDVDMGAVTGTGFTYDWVLKDAEGVVISKNTNEPSVGVTGNTTVRGTITAPGFISTGKAYTLEITNLVPSAYKLTKDSKVTGLAAADVTVTPASAMPSTGSNNLNLSIAANKLVAPEKVTIRFSVTGLDLSDVVLGTGVTGSNGTYDLTVLKSTLASGVDVLKNVKANGAVKFTVESVTDASSKVAVQVKVDAASQKYVKTLNSTIAALNLTDSQVSLANIGLDLKDVVSGWKYSVKVDGKNAVALTDNSSKAITAQDAVPVENLTVGKPVVIEVHIEPTKFTVPATQFVVTGTGTAAEMDFDGNGKIMDKTGFITATGTNTKPIQVTMDASEPEIITSEADGSMNVTASASKMKVDVDKIVDGSDISIKLLQVRSITIDGADPIYWDIRKPYTVPTGTNGTGASVAVDGGAASYVKYGDTVAAADTAVVITTGYVKVTINDTTSAGAMTPNTNYTPIPGLLTGSVKGLAAGDSVTITNGYDTHNIAVTVTDSDGDQLAAGTISCTSAIGADNTKTGTLNVNIGNKDITIGLVGTPK